MDSGLDQPLHVKVKNLMFSHMHLVLSSIGQDCGTLPAPNNGAIQITMTTVGGKATYQCNTGFDLVGVTTRTCQTNGISAQWSDTAPQCNRKSCNLIINGLSQFRFSY